MTENIENTGERIIPGEFKSKEDQLLYLLYLRHLFVYRFVSKTLKNTGIVLELGCGEGYGTSLISKSVKKIIGLDTDKQIVEYASEKHGSSNCIFQVCDGERIPFSDNSFDAVVSFQVIEHVLDDRKFILEIYRVLKKDGIFICTTPNRAYRLKPEQKPWNPFHVREYSPLELDVLLKSVFREVKVSGIRGAEEVQKIEINRVKPGLLISFDLLNLRRFLPDFIKKILADIISKRRQETTSDNNFKTKKYSTEDFYVVDDANQGLDLLGICKK